MARGRKNRVSHDAEGEQRATLVWAPFLYLGPRSSASSGAFLKAAAITHVLSIGSTPAAMVDTIRYARLALTDAPGSSIGKVLPAAIAFIEQARASKHGRVLVHCSAAISRSPTIVAAYLMQMQRMSLRTALGTVIGVRPSVSPNPGFLQQLKELERELFSGGQDGWESSLGVESLPAKREDKLKLFAPDVDRVAQSSTASGA